MTEAVRHCPSDASQLGLPLPKMCYISKKYSKICELYHPMIGMSVGIVFFFPNCNQNTFFHMFRKNTLMEFFFFLGEGGVTGDQ